MSPFARRHTPTCCETNGVHGFVLATSVFVDQTDSLVYGEEWQLLIADSVGVQHRVTVSRCPACGKLLRGVPHVEIDAWMGDSVIDDELRKISEKSAVPGAVATAAVDDD